MPYADNYHAATAPDRAPSLAEYEAEQYERDLTDAATDIEGNDVIRAALRKLLSDQLSVQTMQPESAEFTKQTLADLAEDLCQELASRLRYEVQA